MNCTHNLWSFLFCVLLSFSCRHGHHLGTWKQRINWSQVILKRGHNWTYHRCRCRKVCHQRCIIYHRESLDTLRYRRAWRREWTSCRRTLKWPWMLCRADNASNERPKEVADDCRTELDRILTLNNNIVDWARNWYWHFATRSIKVSNANLGCR